MSNVNAYTFVFLVDLVDSDVKLLAIPPIRLVMDFHICDSIRIVILTVIELGLCACVIRY